IVLPALRALHRLSPPLALLDITQRQLRRASRSLKQPIRNHRDLSFRQLPVRVAVQLQDELLRRGRVHNGHRSLKLIEVEKPVSVPVELYEFSSIVLDGLVHREATSVCRIDFLDLSDERHESCGGLRRCPAKTALAAAD